MKTIRQYFNNAEAEFARSLLASVGIDAVLADENANTLGPGYAPGGVRLQVPDGDAARALKILDGEDGAFTPLPDDFVPPVEVAGGETAPPPLEGFDNARGLIPACLCVLVAMGAFYALYQLLAPLSATHTPRELIRMGIAAYKNGDYAKAVKCYDAALILNPKNYTVYYDRGLAFYGEKDYEKAIADFTKAIYFHSQDLDAYSMRGLAFKKMGKDDKALEDFNKALDFKPENDRAYRVRGMLCSQMGDARRAIEDYRRAMELAPKQWRSYNSLAWVYATWPTAEVRDGAQALELATKACNLSEWKDCYCIGTLAAAEAETGKFDDALKHQRQALAMARADKLVDGKMLQEMAEALADYEQRKPYRDLKK